MSNKKIYPWVVLGLLWVVAVLNYMDRQVLSTMQPAMMGDISELQSAVNFGRLMAIFLWVYGIVSPVAGAIADRIDRKWLITGSLFVWSGVILLMGCATTFDQLYILRAVLGFSQAIYIPAGLALLVDYHGQKTRALAVGIHSIGLKTGSILGGFGGAAAQHYSWQTAFHWIGIVGMIYSVALVIFLKEKRERISKESVRNTDNQPSVVKSMSFLLSNIFFWVILLYFAVPSLPGWATKNWLPTLFSASLSLDMAQAGPLSTVTLTVSAFAGLIFGGMLSDRWIQTNLRGRIYTGAIGLGLMIPSLLLLGLGHSVVVIIGGALCFGIGIGMLDANNMPILCQFVSSRYRATAYGFMNMVGVFAGALITGLLGKSIDAGNLNTSFVLMAVAMLITLMVVVLFLRPKTREMEDKNEKIMNN